MNVYTPTSTSTPTTKKKNKKKTNNKKKKQNLPVSFQQPLRGPGRALSQEELVDHVTQRQTKGDEKLANRGIFTCQAEQAKYLKRLNSRPALVLNADYQVRCLLIDKNTVRTVRVGEETLTTCWLNVLLSSFLVL
jgi:hypothetical protein